MNLVFKDSLHLLNKDMNSLAVLTGQQVNVYRRKFIADFSSRDDVYVGSFIHGESLTIDFNKLESGNYFFKLNEFFSMDYCPSIVFDKEDLSNLVKIDGNNYELTLYGQVRYHVSYSFFEHELRENQFLRFNMFYFMENVNSLTLDYKRFDGLHGSVDLINDMLIHNYSNYKGAVQNLADLPTAPAGWWDSYQVKDRNALYFCANYPGTIGSNKWVRGGIGLSLRDPHGGMQGFIDWLMTPKHGESYELSVRVEYVDGTVKIRSYDMIYDFNETFNNDYLGLDFNFMFSLFHEDIELYFDNGELWLPLLGND